MGQSRHPSTQKLYIMQLYGRFGGAVKNMLSFTIRIVSYYITIRSLDANSNIQKIK